MKYFEKYVSNTLASSGNQSYFCSNGTEQVARAFYKPFITGKKHYSFLFSNIIDSTYADGSFSHKNLILDQWEITSLKVGLCNNVSASCFNNVSELKNVTFEGEVKKQVSPGEFFSTDPIEISVSENQYICIEISFKGYSIPCHPEITIPTFILNDGDWEVSQSLPLPSMVGIERKAEKKIIFIGDSITQGIGTPINSYEHYASIAANTLGNSYAYWNIGIGFARADDAASDGAWLFKAKQGDIVSVCFGVNDILQGYAADEIKKNINTIVDKLNNAGCKVLLQTIPPFDYSPNHKLIWSEVNDYILCNLQSKVAALFDNREFLSDSKNSEKAIFGPHPNSEGCKIWGTKISVSIEKLIK